MTSAPPPEQQLELALRFTDECEAYTPWQMAVHCAGRMVEELQHAYHVGAEGRRQHLERLGLDPAQMPGLKKGEGW